MPIKILNRCERCDTSFYSEFYEDVCRDCLIKEVKNAISDYIMKEETYTSTNSLKYDNASSEILDLIEVFGFTTDVPFDVNNLKNLISKIIKKHTETNYESETYELSVQ